MSHLIIEQGKEVGRELMVPAGGMKFGRSPANELVLDDPAVMLFHGRFFFKSDGTLWVTDFGAGEKTTVGGAPVDEYQLKMGDLVEVGSTAFRVINISLADTPAPAAPAAPPVPVPPAASPEAIDLGFQRAGKPRDPAPAAVKSPQKGTLIHRVMQVSISLLVLLILVVIGSELVKLSGDGSQPPPQRETLALSYERVKADTSNIFRYQLELDDQGVLSVRIDELKSNLHYRKSKKLSDTAVLQLTRGIEEAGFYQVDTDYAGTTPAQYDLFDLAVLHNRLYHRIKVLNHALPTPVERTETVIEDFASRELEIPFTMTMPAEERIRYGEQAFELGKTRYAERDVRHTNLAEAIKHFEEARLFLENIESKRELHNQAVAGLEEASKERDGRYDEFMFRTDRAMALKEWQEASRYLRILSELVPDRADPRYDKVRSKLLSVEQHLR